MKRIILLPLLLAVTGVACTGGDDSVNPRAFGGNQEACSRESLHTYEVTTRADQASYSVGDTAVVFVKVERSASEAGPQRDAGSELENDLTAVSDAKVVVALTSGDTLLLGGGTTDDAGKARVAVKIRKYAAPGSAAARTAAWKEVIDGECLGLVEEGSAYEADFLTIER